MQILKRLPFFLLTFYFLSEHLPGTAAFRVFDDVDGTETILAFENENIKIQCKTDVPMTYCGFLHPKGKRFSFTDRDVNDGQCTIKIKVSKNDDGEWKCHIGRQTVRVETIKKIRVRVVNQVAAIHPNITAVHGKPVTIHCATTNGFVPISYCRFEPPKGSPFNIDSAVTPKNPILGKYFYPQNRSLDRGDCAVTIRKVKYDDVGIWTCGAGLDDGKEYTDVIRIDVEGLYTMSTASATGITFGGILIAIALVILGVMAWKKRAVLGGRRQPPPQPEVIEIQELGQRQRSRSPEPGRMVPSVVVQSPSEPGASPLIPKS
ncbi:uncharacterized protein [Epargyreus clarus]|uniref:uncharacterized protein n=1 Tax=Epargyreus clarus TaxID=520877 RepID=UPI003C2D30D2